MTDPPWLVECRENIAKLGGEMCPAEACEESREAPWVRMVCYCLPPYSNGCPDPPIPGCCAYGPGSPYVIFSPGGSGYCYCCCGGVAPDMTVAVGYGETRPIGEIAVGDVVRAALDPELKHWALVPARFSSGTGVGGGGPSLAIRFGDPHQLETVIVSPDQLLLVQGGRLKRASRLVAGQDSLTRPDGSAAAILDLKAVDSGSPQHRIATSDTPASDWAGHLIVVNGVVCGDYALQLADLDAANPAMLAERHADLPEFGTPAYAKSQAPPGHPAGGSPRRPRSPH